MTMPPPATSALRIGAWSVHPLTGKLSKEGEVVRVEARTLRLLVFLADHAGEIVSVDQLLDQVWSGVVVTPDSVYQAITQLRRTLGDDPKCPSYIATVPRLGYRLVAPVSAGTDTPTHTGDRPAAHMANRTRGVIFAGATLLVLVIIAATLLSRDLPREEHAAVALDRSPGATTIAVLPFLDLTEGMDQEYFSDGMTESLIDRLTKIPGLRVPPPRSSFYFKDKRLTVAEIAERLHVTYVLDGSIRKSGSTLRVGARVVRADDGFVAWSETYERPAGDLLMIQDDIAAEVVKSLRPSTEQTHAVGER